jgi:ABC-type branched-subunit amino acid transport system substrate-binding protein
VRGWSRLVLVLPLLFMSFDARPASGKPENPLSIVFLAPRTGDLAASSAEVFAGIGAAAGYWGGHRRLDGRPVSVLSVDTSGDARAIEKQIAKAKPVAMVVWSRPRTTETIAALARKKRIPCIIASPWEPSFSLDPRDVVFHLAGSTVDHAVAATRYVRIPLAAERAAVLHDDSAGSKALADAFLRNLSPEVVSGGAMLVPADVEATKTLLVRLASEHVDAVFVCSGLPEALRTARAVDRDFSSPTACWVTRSWRLRRIAPGSSMG